jgi:hypothetical protein
MTKPLRFAHDKRRRPYWRDERLLGKTFIDKQHEAVLIIGKDVWTRQDMVEKLRCGNFVAAANLTKIVNALNVESLAQLSNRFTMEDLLVQPHCGITTMWVLMCAIEGQGERNPLDWIDRKGDNIVTLSTEKHRAQKAQVERVKQAREDRRKKVGAGRLVPANGSSAKGA